MYLYLQLELRTIWPKKNGAMAETMLDPKDMGLYLTNKNRKIAPKLR